MAFKVLVFAVAVCSVFAQYGYDAPGIAFPAEGAGAPVATGAAYSAARIQSVSAAVGAEGPAVYSFNYAVSDAASGVNTEQTESRDGDLTEGSYTVRLPDSRIQRVSYKILGDSGYVAEVTYEGEAQFPENIPKQYIQHSPAQNYQQLPKQSIPNAVIPDVPALYGVPF